MQRATRSAAPATAPTASLQPTPIKTPAKRGRKPRQAQETAQLESTEQGDTSMDHPVAASQEDEAISPDPQPSILEVDRSDLTDKVIDVDENEIPVLMSSEEAHMILDVLEKIDADGLLDQSVSVAAVVFSQSSSDQHEVSSTLRSLLDQSNDVSLRHIYKAAQNFTLRVAPRSRRRSAVIERTKKFCDLLHQLLLELIQSKGAVSGQRVDLEVLQNDMKQPPSNSPYYALFQQLGRPAGTYFSSPAQLSKDQLGRLSLGQAETVAVVPTQLLPSSDIPTLSSLVSHRIPKSRQIESLSTVKRLPYDPFGSFAPTYATDAAQVESYDTILARQAAAAFRRWEKRDWPNFRRLREVKPATRSRKSRSGKVERESSRGQKRARENDDDESDRVKRRKFGDEPIAALEGNAAPPLASTADTCTSIVPENTTSAPHDEAVIDPSLLEADLLKEVESILGQGDGQPQIDQLLHENAEALLTLRTLQDIRLRTDGKVTEELAEFQLAKAIEGSLSMLVDWQPRSSQNPQIPSLAPVQAVLSKVERILPLEPVPSYKGILKPNSAALKDNTTIRIAASNTIANTHAFASTPGTFGTATPGSQRFAPRHPSYPHATYPSAQAASYPPVYASQAYASSHATTQAYSQYAGGYGVNGNSYAASAYSGYASSPQGYAAYPSYAYGVGAAAYPTGTYTPTQHSTARPSQTTAQAWSYAAHTPAAALPPHMRTAASRPSGYSTPTAQPYAPWSKA